MAYLELENGKCEGWTIPMYYDSALKFAEEVKEHCKEDKTIESAGKTKTSYRYQDGTRFILTFGRDEDGESELVTIEAKDIYDNDFQVIYSN